MSFGIIVIAIIFIGLIIYNTNNSNQSSFNKNTEPRRVTMDSIKPRTTAKSTSYSIVFYGKIKKQIIECEYGKEIFRCDVVINIDVNSQTVSYMEMGNMKKFKSIERRFNKQSTFIELSNVATNETHYLKSHFKNNHLYSVELTNSKDTGFIYFDNSIFNQKS